MTQKLKVTIPFERSLYLLHPYNTSLITSKGKNEKINIMAVAWITPVSVNPPLLAMSIRSERYSYNLIIDKEEFVVNIPTFEQAQKVLFCGRRSGRTHDKFEKAKLTPLKAKRVDVPIIGECVAHLECKVVRTIKLGEHVLIVGQIIKAYALDGYFNEVYNTIKFHPCLHIGKNFFTTCSKEIVEPTL